MSWHCSQGLVGEFSVAAYLVGLRWRPARSIPTVGTSCSSDKKTARLTPSRSGMTCRPSTADRGAGVPMSSPPGGLAKGLAQQESNEGSTMSDPAYGLRWPALSMRFDRVSYSWRIVRALFPPVGSPDACPTLPRSGTMRRGILSERDTLAHRTGAIDAGSLPKYATPTATMRPCEGTVRAMRRLVIRGEISESEASAINGRDIRKPQGKVESWPTPSARDWKDTPGMTAQRKDGKSRDDQLPRRVYSRGKVPAGGGKLNPTWVEWLMGWPIGWTDCEPLEMDRFHRWPRSPFKPCAPDSTAGGEE